jgi:hypothetical protein
MSTVTQKCHDARKEGGKKLTFSEMRTVKRAAMRSRLFGLHCHATR